MVEPRRHCQHQTCPVQVMGPWATSLLAYATGALVLGKPIANSLNANVKNLLDIAGMTVSFTSIGLALIWLLSGYLAASERYSHPLLCVINASGVPGLILALLTTVQA